MDAFDHVERVAGDPAGEDDSVGGLLVDWEIQLTHETPGRTQEVTVIGRGYKNGTTLTFWRDANFDGVRDTGEEELCRTLVDGNDIGYCSFTVYKPPFVQGSGKCDPWAWTWIPGKPQTTQTATSSTRWTVAIIPPPG